MKEALRIHNRNHIIKSILGNVEGILSAPTPNELYVVNYHGTQKKFLSNFNAQLDYFQKKYTLISPADLSDFYSGSLKKSSKPYLLLSFDDGIQNNQYAIGILNKRNIKAFFFVIPDFIDTAVESQKEYFVKCIRPVINSAIDNEDEDFISLTWKELQAAQGNGHAIGSHTRTHTLVAASSTLENSIREITQSKKLIADRLACSAERISTFCSINNTLESIGEKELKLIRENYGFHFTTIPGPNLPGSNVYFVKRANIESHWLLGAVKYALGKWDQKRWKNAAAAYERILNKK